MAYFDTTSISGLEVSPEDFLSRCSVAEKKKLAEALGEDLR